MTCYHVDFFSGLGQRTEIEHIYMFMFIHIYIYKCVWICTDTIMYIWKIDRYIHKCLVCMRVYIFVITCSNLIRMQI